MVDFRRCVYMFWALCYSTLLKNDCSAQNSTSSPPESTDCITVEFVGRMGNLMFQYAAMVGYCHRRGLAWEYCAHAVNPKYYEADLPLKEMMYNFHIPYKRSRYCQLRNQRYTEHAHDVHAMMFDKDVLKVEPGTTVVGYLQSWRYFHPHAESQVRHIFRLKNDAIREQGQGFILDVRKSLPSPDYKVVGVHIRLGDKVGNSFYNSWALSEAYYQRAIELLNRRHANVSLVFFTGGALDAATIANDEDWTHQHYGAANQYVFFESSGDHLVALQSLMSCDAIIVAHSSFSWWAAYLSNSLEIVAPKQMFPLNGPGYNYEDYYLPWWTLLDENHDEDRIIGVNPF